MQLQVAAASKQPQSSSILSTSRTPGRIDCFALSNTAFYLADPTGWLNRINAVQDGGVASIADVVLVGWLRSRKFQTQDWKSSMLRTFRMSRQATGLPCRLFWNSHRMASAVSAPGGVIMNHDRPQRPSRTPYLV